MFASRLLIRAVDDDDDDDAGGAGVPAEPAVSVGFAHDDADDDPTTDAVVTLLDFGVVPTLFGSSLIVSAFGSALIEPSAS